MTGVDQLRFIIAVAALASAAVIAAAGGKGWGWFLLFAFIATP